MQTAYILSEQFRGDVLDVKCRFTAPGTGEIERVDVLDADRARMIRSEVAAVKTRNVAHRESRILIDIKRRPVDAGPHALPVDCRGVDGVMARR